jgi:hypothetical protein
MSNVLTRKYSTFVAQSFLNGLVANGTINAYVFLGHPLPWNDDNNPPAPTDTVQTEDYDAWRDMIAAKRVASANTQFVVARRDWVTGTIYDQYDDTNSDLQTSKFYVLDTSQIPYRVYKCLWNNHGVPSTNAPSAIGATVNPTATADGYVWQYMYSVTSIDYKFLTSAWMPVLTDSSVITNAQSFPGRLSTAVPLLVVDGGASYNAALSTVTVISGDGANASVSANGVTITAGRVVGAVLASGGQKYTQVTSIDVSQPNISVTPATLRAIIPPYPNHGADAIKELGAKTLLMSVTFSGSESGKLTTVNNFRRAGLLINPTETTGNAASATFYRQTWDITFSANTGVLQPDDAVTNITKASAPTGIVVDVVASGNNYVARLTNVATRAETTPFSAGETVKCLASGVQITVASVAQPELKPFSGSIAYVTQVTPVTRGPAQNEELKLVFSFG